MKEPITAAHIFLHKSFVLIGVAATDNEEVIGRVEPPELFVPAFVAFDRDRRPRKPVGIGELVGVGIAIVVLAARIAVVAIIGLPRVTARLYRRKLLAGVFDRGFRALLFSSMRLAS